ncbi:MAG: DUF4908 domain-containing protein [Maricaulaceae bacterium]|jgi:hypothetical protein
MNKKNIGGVRAVAAGLVASLGLALGLAYGAQAQQRSLADTLSRNQVEGEAAIYETADSHYVFVLDRTGEPPLLRFANSFEVFVLSRVPASRGDEILRTDAGDDLLRVTPLGGVTLYPREWPTGLPAARIAAADPLPRLRGVDLLAALDELRMAAAGADIDAPPAASQAATLSAFGAIAESERSRGDLLADAARVTAEALDRVRLSEEGSAKVASMTRIQFEYGQSADARFSGGVLTVQVVSGAGYAGRPSSLRVADSLTDE